MHDLYYTAILKLCILPFIKNRYNIIVKTSVNQNTMTKITKNIVVVGAGFGGVTAALNLAKKIESLKNDYEIILIDRRHHQLYAPALYEIASIPRENVADISLKSSVLIPIADIVKNKPIKFVCDELAGLDARNKRIFLKNTGELKYEFLILALGSETNYFDIPGLKEYGYPLKTFDDGVRLRNAFENMVKGRDGIRVVVGGAGASGVELAAEFVNFVCDLKQKGLDHQKKCDVRFTLAEGSPEILPGFEPWVIDKAKKRLAQLGIKIKTNKIISSVSKNEIVFNDGSKENYDILVWTGGVKGPEILRNFSLPLSNKDSIVINEYLGVQDRNGNIFAIGDNSTLVNPATGKSLIWNVPVAEAEGRLVAKNIIREILGKPKKKFIPMKKYPFILAVGKKYAIADLVFIKFSGFLGWLLKQLVELRYLLFILPPGKALETWFKGLKYFSSND